MAQQFKVLVAPAKYPGLVPACNSSSSGLPRHQTHMRYTRKQNTHMHEKIILVWQYWVPWN